MTNPPILVGMSGGVDSSTAAYLLKKDGHEVTGYILLFRDDQRSDIDDAARVAHEIGIKFEVIDARSRFENDIIVNFLNEYRLGHTPSPCCRCNILKFGIAFEFGKANAIDLVATGHYACSENGYLYCSPVHGRDQVYFLSRIPKEWLANIRFPLCTYEKNTVRAIASDAGLHCAQKQDSQDICFIDTDYRHFLYDHGFESKKGPIVENGKTVGFHDGYFRYTIGQRIQLGGLPGKRFVHSVDIDSNTVFITPDEELFHTSCHITDLNLFTDPQSITTPLFAKIRSRDTLHSCAMKSKGSSAEILFQEPVRAITPGQLGVVYTETIDGKFQVVGSGWIEK